jgi:hypothetical protein
MIHLGAIGLRSVHGVDMRYVRFSRDFPVSKLPASVSLSEAAT